MKNFAMLVAALGALTLAACGGSGSSGGGTPTPTATNDNTKAVSEATVQATNSAMGAASLEGLKNLAPTASLAASFDAKEAYGADINYTYECTVGGSVLATGSMTASCDGTDSSWSCSGMVLNLALQFNDCMETATVDGTAYTVALNGSGSAEIGGSTSGTDTYVNLDMSGNAKADLTAAGDANGTVSLDFGIDVSGTIEPGPAITCSGTASVVSDEITEVCGITSDCSGCEA